MSNYDIRSADFLFLPIFPFAVCGACGERWQRTGSDVEVGTFDRCVFRRQAAVLNRKGLIALDGIHSLSLASSFSLHLSLLGDPGL